MSFFKKMMASVGIGAAKVDTVIENASGVRVGDELYGRVSIRAGNVAQEVNHIDLCLYANYFRERDGHVVEERDQIYRYRLNERFSLQPGDEREFSFSFPLPNSTPITLGKTKVWVDTQLDIEMAMDKTDRDYVQVMAHPIVGAFFDVMERYGLRMYEVSLLHVPHLRLDFPFLQEFELKPQRRSRLEELEVFYVCHGDHVEFYLEIDRRAKGFGGLLEEAFDMNERHIKVTVTKDDIADSDALYRWIVEAIEENL
ncbi:sporulation protein [Paenibacillus sp. MBLB4367]|uniref:sporulation protein n=1 Tax=Paenibacillus sp. MBLB4367 TaxID=3384767 RepID=UPI003907ECEB